MSSSYESMVFASRARARLYLGWLTFIFTIASAAGMLVSLVGNAWLGVPGSRAVGGFLGFGIPMLFAGVGTGLLWENRRDLLDTLGRVSASFGIARGVALGCAHGLCLLFFLGEVLAGSSDVGGDPGVGLFIGLSVGALMCGGSGAALLFWPDREADDAQNDHASVEQTAARGHASRACEQ